MAPATSPSTDATAKTWLSAFDTLARICQKRWPTMHAALEDVLVLARQLATVAPQAFAEVHPCGDGMRSPALDGGGRSIGSHADPTYAIAVSAVEGRGKDETRAHDAYRQADAGANLARLCLLTLARQTDPDLAHRNLRAARDHLLVALGRYHRTMGSTDAEPPDTEGDPGCKSCRRADKSNGDGRLWNPVFRDGLCQWCRREAVANQKAWMDKHPGQQPAVVGSKLWWPNVRLIEWRRDNGDKYLTPAQRKRLEKPRKKAS